MRVQGSIRLEQHERPPAGHRHIAPPPAVRCQRPYYPEDIFLVIEVANTSLRYDSGPKLARYAAAGIVEVWIVNLRDAVVTAYTDLSESANIPMSELTKLGESISPQAFPDVSIAVADFVAPPDGSFDETD